MKPWLLGLSLLAAFPAFAASPWREALPDWVYEFPRDHHAHSEFKTEWWYVTGNLKSDRGREFGFQLTFFRQGVRRGEEVRTRFAPRDIKLAHFAVTDVQGGGFRFAQKVSRGAFGEAGFSEGAKIAWIDDWELRQDGAGSFSLRAGEGDLRLVLDLRAGKPPVFHGERGVSQKSEGAGRGSHYYSFTRMEARGKLSRGPDEEEVSGEAWFDQEWATNQLAENQTGWDWLSLQFDDGSELMLFQIRLKEGGRDSHSHGTWVGADGSVVPVKNQDFELRPGRVWRSAETGAAYPVEWRVRIPKLDLEVDLSPALDRQELVLKPVAYWEGSMRAQGTRAAKPLAGRGYLEMTGYATGLVGLQAPEAR
ncbi:MAG: lipocalin-like domain-containing protein [Chthoniobacterales bacterium]|jgi:predicted secreted hydrolase